MGKAFKNDAKTVSEYLLALPTDELKILEAKAKADGKVAIEINGASFEVTLTDALHLNKPIL